MLPIGQVLMSADIVSSAPTDGNTKIRDKDIVAKDRVNDSLTSHSLRDEDEDSDFDNHPNHSPGVNNNNNSLSEINILPAADTNIRASLGSPYAVLETTPRNEVIPNNVDSVTMSWFIESKAARTQEDVLGPIDHDYIFGSWEPGTTIKFDISNNASNINSNNNKAEYSLVNCNKSVEASPTVNQLNFMLQTLHDFVCISGLQKESEWWRSDF